MSLLARLRDAIERRVGLRSQVDPGFDDSYYVSAGGRTLAGIDMSETLALNVNSLMACIRLMVGTMSSLPFGLFERMEGGGRQPVTDHPVQTLIHDQFNDNLPADEGIAVLALHFELRSNAFAQKIFDGGGQVVALHPLNPDRMTVTVDRGTGTVRYLYRQPDGTNRAMLSDEVFHLRGFGTDGITGINKVQVHRESIGLTQAAEAYGAAHFGNAAQVPIAIKFPQGVKFKDTEAAQLYLKNWNEAHQGPFRAGKTALLENGGEPVKIGVTPEESQFLGTRVFQLEEMARLVGYIPMHLLNETEKSTSWGTGIETQNTAFVQYGLLWRCRRWEGAVRQQLLSEDDRRRYFARLSLEGLLRGDTAARGTFYQILRRLSVASDQDILRFEDMPPKPGPPTYWQPLDVKIVDGEGNVLYEPPTKSTGAPAGTSVEAFQPLLEATLARVYRRAMQDWPKAHSEVERDRWAAEHAAFLDGQLAPVFAAITAARIPLKAVTATRLRPEEMGNGLDPVAFASREARALLGA